MAKGKSLGKAYVQIVPSAEGISGSIGKIMSDAGGTGGSSFSAAFAKTAIAGISSAAIGKAIAASITEGAALEQSLGGVETLFKENSDKVVKYADEAFRTAGVSANTYMEQVTSFSATLLQGLGGDTAKAAKYANTAMIDMSDNVNKFGTDMQAIQNAYQGFAKQNYTMLDNLKLGYGGTQEEMARLINDSGVLGDSVKVTAQTVKDVPFSDVITAIHTIQGNLGITGTTAKEAATTFSGSMQAMKSAASNLLGHLSTGTGNIDEDVKALEDTAITFGGNLTGMLSKINSGLSESEGAVGALYNATKSLAVITAAYFATLKLTAAIKGLQGMNAAMIQGKLLAKAINAEMAIMANGPAIIVAAAAAAGMAVKGYIDDLTDSIDETCDGYDELNDRQKEFVDSCGELNQKISESREEREKNLAGIDAEAEGYKKMVDRLYTLNDAESLTNEQKSEMKTIVEELNKSIPGLNIAIDQQTGYILNQRDAVDDLVDSYTKQAKAQAAEESLVELYKQQYEAEKKLEEAEDNRAGAYNALSELQLNYANASQKYWDFLRKLDAEGTDQYEANRAQLEALRGEMNKASSEIDKAKDKVGEMNNAYITSKETVRNVDGEISYLSDIIKENSTAADTAADSLADYGKAASGAADEVSKTFTVSQETFDKISEIANNYAASANNIDETTKGIADSLNIFSAFNWDDELNADEMISNLESNLNAMDWGTNGIDTLKRHADELGVTINDNLLAKLEEMGPDAANQLRAMCNMSETELQQYSDLYGKYYAMAQEKATNELEKLKEESAMQLQEIMEQAEHQAVPLTDMYNYLAECAVSGFEGGVINNTDSLRAAGREIYLAVEEGYKEASETNSPSRAMRRLGKFLPEGAALGIEDGTDIVKASAANMAKAAISSAEPLRASAPATDIDIGTVRRAAAQYDYGSPQTAVKSDGTSSKSKPAVINLNINGRTFAQATADFIDLENGAALALKERGVAR